MTAEDELKEWFNNNYEPFMQQFMKMEGPFNLESEITIANGQQVDKVIYGSEKLIQALIEMKGTCNLTEFIRGVGQAQQQNHQIKMNMNENFSDKAKSFLLIPVDMKNSSLLFDLFDLRDMTLIFCDIEKNTFEEFHAGTISSSSNWINISPKWFRDCSLPGLYFCLKMVAQNTGLRKSDRKNDTELHDEIKKFMTDKDIKFFNDVKNNFITNRKLGFVDEKSLTLTAKGLEYSKKSFEQFCKSLVLIDLGEYSRAVWISISSMQGKCSTNEISEFIEKEIYNGKKVKFLHDDDGGARNIGTIIRMLETIGSLKRISQKEYKMNYPPFIGMPFDMKKFNGQKITGDDYNDRIMTWFNEFNFDFE